jgi:eukaryotic-like serine/threonine-protein kinase
MTPAAARATTLRPVRQARIGTVVAKRYRLISQLGSGAMASVYLARHVVIERLCAIKIFRPEGGATPPLRERFLREARAVNRIHHPNIVEITDFGESSDLAYLVMEYVPGEPLSRVIESAPLQWRSAARVGVQIASALERAHEMGVIHRDLKPANVIVQPKRDGEYLVKLTDFGVANIADEPRLTATSGLVGTPGYMAPEYQLSGRFDARSDLYSLGVLLFEATTGRLPLEPLQAPGAPFSQQLLAPPPSVRTFVPEIDPFFDDVLSTLLAPDPDDRPRDAFEASDLIERALSTTPRVSSLPPPSASSVPASREPASELRSRSPDPREAPPEAGLRRPGPRLLTAPHGRVLPICLTALERISQGAQGKPSGPEVAHAIARAERQVAMVGRIARMVEGDSQEENALRAEARSLHADLGRKLDDAARERSKLLGWAGTAAERAYEVDVRLSLGVDPIPTMEAMVWERAALEATEAEAHERAGQLAAEIAQIQGELERKTERIENDLAVVTARLWGRVGALRALALEAWMELEAAAKAAGVPVESLTSG